MLAEDVSHREVDKEEIYLYLLHVLQNPQFVFLWEILLWMKFKIGIKKDIGTCYFSARYITHMQKSKRQERHIYLRAIICSFLLAMFVVWPLP